MVVIRITDLDIPTGVTHLATDWQIATDELFSNVIIESLDDQTNLTSITFNDSLDPDDRYYARARVLLTTGWTIWGNIDIFIIEDVFDTDDNLDMPGVITPPTITTDSDVNNHIPSLFNISVSGFSTTGTGSHHATSYFIVDLDGKYIWSDVYDEINKDTILIDEIILEPGKVYLIKAMLHSTSGDTSQQASRVIYVNEDNLIIDGNIESLDTVATTELTIFNRCDDIASTEWIVYALKEDGLHEIVRYNNEPGRPRTVIINGYDLRSYEHLCIGIIVTTTDGIVEPIVYKEASTTDTIYADNRPV